MAALEIITVLSISAFIYLMTNPNNINQNFFLREVLKITSLYSSGNSIGTLSILIFFIIVTSSITSFYANLSITRFSMHLGNSLIVNLFNFYLKKDYIFHTLNNSSKLINNVHGETTRIYSGIFIPLLQLNAKLIISLFLIVNLFLTNFQFTIIIISLLAFIYVFIYFFVKGILTKNGKTQSRENQKRYDLMGECFRGIKEIKVLNIEDSFYRNFKTSSEKLATCLTTSAVIAQSPKFLLETIAFGGLCLMVAYLVNTGQSIETILPTLSIFTITGYKMMPAIQQVFSSVSSMKSNSNALDNIYLDLKEANLLSDTADNTDKIISTIPFQKEITFSNISFSYPNVPHNAINNISLKIKANSKIAFVGSSGAGKTTLADILISILQFKSGHLFCDNLEITPKNVQSWQNIISYVPQTIFLSDTSLAENIALGIEKDKIDLEKLRQSILLSDLKAHVDLMPKKEWTTIGESGVQLSGGQRQRIGIARALYKDTPILILDEATSALDGITERNIMNSIEQLSNKKTIVIIAHRLSTVKTCDIIYMFHAGQIIDQGTYDHLMLNNLTFQKMAYNDKKKEEIRNENY